MALIKCKECGTEISDKAEKCIKCGAPVPKSQVLGTIVGWIVLLIIFGAVLSTCSSSDDGAKEKKKEASEESQCAKDDLSCLGNKGVVGAGVYCKDRVEKMAAHSVKWTDGTFDLKFSRFMWKDKSAGVITYIGDKAEFQNGFGAYTPVIYECDMLQDNQTVVDVRVTEGRLP